MKTILTLKCDFCNENFNRDIRQTHHKSLKKFCSHKCRTNSQITLKKVVCKQCNKSFMKTNSNCIKSPNHFCNKSCSAIYNNTHKTKGNRRSKLEIWLENKLTILYPTLLIDFNKKDIINSELDLYFSELKLAIELNGIFHYEPIYGPEKLSKIQNNDTRKYQACLEKGIELCIIDTSSLKYFKDSAAQKYLDIIIQVLNKKFDRHINSVLL